MPRALPLVAALTAAALVASGTPVARADHTLDHRAEQIVREVLATDPAQGTLPGIVIARGPDLLAARNPREPFVPASLQKLATTSAALARFGPDHRFTTTVFATAQKPNGSVGKLILVGGGDPTLATGAFRTRYFIQRDGMSGDERVFPSGSPTVGQLARAIENAGVTRVRGNLLADDTLFDRIRTQEGWKSSYLDRSTGGPHVGLISALTVNQGYSDLEQRSIASSPALFAARRLRAALKNRGIVVDGRVVARDTPDGADPVASVSSPPLDEIVGWINRWSANLPAEMLLKSLGAAFGDAGSTAEGRRILKQTLRNENIPLQRFRMKDGSGLSLDNRVMPHSLGAILRWALRTRTPAARAFRRSLPVACRAGTLLHRMCDTAADGNLRGKTGLITDVRGMAGWVRGSDDERTVYVALFNRAPNESALTSTLNLLGRRLARFP